MKVAGACRPLANTRSDPSTFAPRLKDLASNGLVNQRASASSTARSSGRRAATLLPITRRYRAVAEYLIVQLAAGPSACAHDAIQ